MGVNKIISNNLVIKDLFFADKLVLRAYCGDTLVYARDMDMFKFPLLFIPYTSFGDYIEGQHMYPLIFDDDIIF